MIKRIQTRPQATLEARSEVWRTIDSGETWLPVHRDGLGVVHRLAIDPRRPARLLAATSTGLWEMRGSDGWFPRFAKHCTDVAIDPADPDVVYAATSGTSVEPGVYRSSDGGLAWPTIPHIPVDGNQRFVGRVALRRHNRGANPQTAANSSVDGGDNWPTMLPQLIAGTAADRGRNFAKGLVTTEFRSVAPPHRHP